jgi:hypothetical protein
MSIVILRMSDSGRGLGNINDTHEGLMEWLCLKVEVLVIELST